MPASPLLILHGRMYAGRRFVYERLINEYGAQGIAIGRSPLYNKEIYLENLTEAINLVTQSNESVTLYATIVNAYQVDIETQKLARRRPQTLFMEITSPLLLRFKRSKYPSADLLRFICDDEAIASQLSGLPRDISILTDTHEATDARIRAAISRLPALIRPSWDLYFMRIAFMTASRSNCRKRRVGAVVVRDHRISATGYNGTPSGGINCMDGGCRRCLEAGSGQQLEACECIHAEANAVLEVGRRACIGCSLYVTALPCLGCAKLIVQAGIKTVVYYEEYGTGMESKALFLRHGVDVQVWDSQGSISELHNLLPVDPFTAEMTESETKITANLCGTDTPERWSSRASPTMGEGIISFPPSSLDDRNTENDNVPYEIDYVPSECESYVPLEEV